MLEHCPPPFIDLRLLSHLLLLSIFVLFSASPPLSSFSFYLSLSSLHLPPFWPPFVHKSRLQCIL